MKNKTISFKDNVTKNFRTADTAEAEKKEFAATDTKKFKSVDALLKAYLELEAEFTRRSQRLKELEEGNKASPDGDVPSPAQVGISEGAPAVALSDGGRAEKTETQTARETQETAKLSEAKPSEAKPDLKSEDAEKAHVNPADAAQDAEVIQGTAVGGLTEEQKRAVIEEYLLAVASGKSVPLIVGGVAAKAPKNTPKTVREASELARRFLK